MTNFNSTGSIASWAFLRLLIRALFLYLTSLITSSFDANKSTSVQVSSHASFRAECYYFYRFCHQRPSSRQCAQLSLCKFYQHSLQVKAYSLEKLCCQSLDVFSNHWLKLFRQSTLSQSLCLLISLCLEERTRLDEFQTNFHKSITKTSQLVDNWHGNLFTSNLAPN